MRTFLILTLPTSATYPEALTTFMSQADAIEFASGAWVASLAGTCSSVSDLLSRKVAAASSVLVFEILDFRRAHGRGWRSDGPPGHD